MSTSAPALAVTRAADSNMMAPRTETTFLATLAHLRTVLIQGENAAEFLQGQLSNDVRLLSPQLAQLSCHSSAKGRVLFIATLRAAPAGVWLELDEAIAEPALKRLKMFVLRAKVQFPSAAELPPAILGLAGDWAESALRAAGFEIPQTAWALATHPDLDLQLLRRPGDVPRFTVHGVAELIDALEQRLRATQPDMPALTDSEEITRRWRLLDFAAGVPRVVPATQDHFVAQMLNLDTLGGISFNKGCYTGQEIVARMHYLGNLKRRMLLLRSPHAVAAGMPILAVEGDGQAVGEVVDAAQTDAGDWQVQAVVQIAQHDAALQVQVTDDHGAATPLTAYLTTN